MFFFRKFFMPLPENIKIIRDRFGLTQPQFGKLFGATKPMIQYYENGNAKPKYPFLNKLSYLIDIPVEKIVDQNITGSEIAINPGLIKALQIYNEINKASSSGDQVIPDKLYEDFYRVLKANSVDSEDLGPANNLFKREYVQHFINRGFFRIVDFFKPGDKNEAFPGLKQVDFSKANKIPIGFKEQDAPDEYISALKNTIANQDKLIILLEEQVSQLKREIDQLKSNK